MRLSPDGVLGRTIVYVWAFAGGCLGVLESACLRYKKLYRKQALLKILYLAPA